jgi:POT family proton-dependent oligopeptide transporter
MILQCKTYKASGVALKKTADYLRQFPQTFWVANTMEIFERMAWYGFYAVSSLYITGSKETGGLGFTDEDRGLIQAVVPFFLYLFPALTGAMADKYGFKKMLFWSFVVLTPSYFLLGQVKDFYMFFAVFMVVAFGAAMFKPVIIGTVSKTTNEKTGTVGFGIFYMMVNIGGFLGPIAAGVVRGWSWEYVFIASSFWIALNFIFVLLFFKEPPTEVANEATKKNSFLVNMVEVLGNGRFFVLIFINIFIMLAGAKLEPMGVLGWSEIFAFMGIWTVGNILIDLVLKKAAKETTPWFLQPLKIGDWKFLVFLLLMAGFWTSFNQIFLTLPLYIRDYVDTRDILTSMAHLNGFLGFEEFAAFFNEMVRDNSQIKPEYIININALGIILFQVIISFLMTNLKPFTTIFWGVLVTAVSFTIFLFGSMGWIVVMGIFVFSIGEMMASPKSKEYTGNIAPPEKVGMYMGYFYWCVALGNLFGGLLSGQMYALYGRDLQDPDTMWLIFAALAVISAFLIYFFDRYLKSLKNRASA